MDGVLVVDKPPGPTSHDVVVGARRALGIRRIGHTGTLDPLATGVLPLVIGRATRLASLLAAGEKSYDASVRLGSATASYDAAERLAAGVPPPPPPDLREEAIAAALEEFRGTFMQAPPPYSAKKIGGIAAHRLARKSKWAQPPPVRVTLSAIESLAYGDGLLRIAVTVSAGFYVRSLAHDLGVRLGCGAHLEALRRTRAGGFTLADSISLDVLEAEGPAAAGRLVPLEMLLPEIPAMILNERGARRASHGALIGPEDAASAQRGAAALAATGPVRLLDGDGRLVAIARAGAEGALRPVIVLV